MANEVELKPCPFCGGKVVIANLWGRWWVKCCGCDVWCGGKSQKDVAAAWNRRAKV